MASAGEGRRAGRLRAPLAAAAAVALAGLLGWAVADLPRGAGGLGDEVAARMAESGVRHEVTAVLLNFRAYDTWLEVAVVLAAAAGVLALARAHDLSGWRSDAARHPLLTWMTGIVVPASAIAGGVLLWLGTSAPGGAFQAGAVLGAAAVLMWLAGGRSVDALPGPVLTAGLAAGVAGFAIAAAATLAAGRALLELPPGWAGEVIVAVEAAVTVAVAVSLPALFLAARPAAGGEG